MPPPFDAPPDAPLRGTSAPPARGGGARRAFAQGAAAGVPFLIVGLPFGLLFGVVATEAGLNIVETMTLTSLVIAGASQFALVELLSDGAPAAVALFASLAVNLRMAMYSASLAPHLGGASLRTRLLAAYFLVDQVYAASVARYAAEPEMTRGDKLAFYFGVGAPMFLMWYGGTYLGAVAGAAIPDRWPLDFAPAITFIAIVAPMLRGAAALSAAFVAVSASLALAWIPWSLGLPLAAGLGMAAGAWVERAAARRRAETAP